MKQQVAVVGAGVSGLTCAVVLAEQGYSTSIFAEETGQRTTSAAAGAIWYPYDVEPIDAAIKWSLETYQTLKSLSGDARTGVSMIELRTFSRAGKIQIPDWADSLGAQLLTDTPKLFASGFRLAVPLTDTTIYLDYLRDRFAAKGGSIHQGIRFRMLEDVDREFALVINCSGIGAKKLVPDPELEPHRGQVAIVPKLNFPYAVVCDDAPLMYAIPRANDCLFGGTNELSDNREPNDRTTEQIVAECSRVLNIEKPRVLAERVGLRPFRKAGICLRADRLNDGRPVIHNYGHGGAGFTLSWGCAREVLRLADHS